MEPLFVVDLLEEAFDRGLGVRQIAVFLSLTGRILGSLHDLDDRLQRRSRRELTSIQNNLRVRDDTPELVQRVAG
ncbi:MAG: hypothetical protein DMG27_20975 [Acidobacteria bacterium]|nr:MAG: hypothetical protein DMG27_20975 [Acidobacteriota bacterium]